jgi:hypothetical protein
LSLVPAGSVVFKPLTSAGQVRVRVTTAVDQEGTIAVNGPLVTATIAQPGAVTRLRFNGVAGQRVYTDVISSTLPDDCFPLALQRRTVSPSTTAVS